MWWQCWNWTIFFSQKISKDLIEFVTYGSFQFFWVKIVNLHRQEREGGLSQNVWPNPEFLLKLTKPYKRSIKGVKHLEKIGQKSGLADKRGGGIKPVCPNSQLLPIFIIFFSCPLTLWQLFRTPFWKKHCERLVTLETCNECDEETLETEFWKIFRLSEKC